MRRVVLFAFVVTVSAHAQAPEPPAGRTWAGDFGFGLSLTRGNSDTSNIHLTADAAQRLNAANLMRYDAFYLRSDTSGTLTADRLLFGARDEYTISPAQYALR